MTNTLSRLTNTLVVARYNEDTDWYRDIPREWTLKEVQKGRELPNEGREASSYLWAILDLYDTLEDWDRVAFVQGNPFQHCQDIDLFLLLRKPVHGFLALGDDNYVCDALGRPHHEGLPLAERYEEWLGRHYPGFSHFAPGAQFVVDGRTIRQHPKELYARLLAAMSVDPNPWVMERVWAPLFVPEKTAECLATFYCQATPATTYLRCELPARYLPGKVSRDLILAQNDTDYWFPHHEGAAVFQFAGDSTYALMAHALASDSPGGKHQAVRVLVEVDDNYFATGPNLVKTGWVKRIGQGVHALEGHASIVRHADGVIVTTEYLAKQYRKRNPNTFVCPNSLDPCDWPTIPKPDDGIVRVGWFASDSHKADAQLVHRALEWCSRQDGVEVVTMGYNPPWKFRRKHIGWQDLPGYREAMFELDIGVCPVVPDPWANSRSDVKALEKTWAGAALVLSDVPPYDLWAHGETCLKATTPRDWLDRVRWLVRNERDRKDLARNGRSYVAGERLTEHVAWRWAEAIEEKSRVKVAA